MRQHAMKGIATTAWILIVALALIAGGAYLYFGPGALAPQSTGGEDQESAEFTSSLTAEELIARGQNVTCTFAFAADGSNSSGTVFVADGKLRGDYVTNAGGQAIRSHVILRDGASHIWMDGSNEGFKASVVGTVTTGGGNAAPDINSKLDYDCSAWTPDQSKFALPAGVTFREVSIPTPS